MNGFWPNDITQFGRNLGNIIAMSSISGTKGNNFCNLNDKTTGKLLQ